MVETPRSFRWRTREREMNKNISENVLFIYTIQALFQKSNKNNENHTNGITFTEQVEMQQT